MRATLRLGLLVLLAMSACTRRSFEPLEEKWFGARPAGAAPAAFAGKGLKPFVELKGHTEATVHAAFTPDGRHVVTAGYGDYLVISWSVADGRVVSHRKSEHRPTAVAVMPDGTTALTADVYGNITYWPLADGALDEGLQVSAKLEGQGGIRAFALSPNGKVAALVAGGKPLTLWDIAGRKALRTLGAIANLSAVAFSPDGALLAVGADSNTFRVIDLRRGTERACEVSKVAAKSTITGLAFSADGKFLGTSHNESTFSIWDATTMKELHNHYISQAGAMGVAFSADSQVMATVHAGNGVYLWKPATRTLLECLERKEVGSIAFSPDGKTLAVSSGKTVELLR